MKILQVITSLRTGGAERLVTDFSKGFAAAGDLVEVLLFDGSRTPMVEELEAAAIPVYGLGEGAGAMNNPLLLFKLNKFLGSHSYDIIHTHNTPCQFMLALASLLRPLTLVTTEHNTTNRRRKMKFLKPLERWMYGRYRRIVCVGDETRLSLADHLKTPELESKMITVPNGIDLGKFYAASPAVDLMKTKGYSITMVAAFRPQKDQQTLIRAIAMLPNRFRLFLAGGSETDADRIQLEDCRRLVNELGVADRVCFLGIRNDVPALFAASDLVAFSTHYEGMSLSVIEGMASGKPFVASDVSGVRDMVEGAGVLFPEGNAERLAAIISHLSEDPAAATETGKRCRQRAGMYDIRHTIRRYRDEYDSIVSNV